jgi:hypothetical protein
MTKLDTGVTTTTTKRNGVQRINVTSPHDNEKPSNWLMVAIYFSIASSIIYLITSLTIITYYLFFK